MIIYADVDYDHLKTESTISDDVNYTPHFHAKYELLYVIELDGEAYSNISGAVYPIQKGDLILVKPGTLHNLSVRPNIRYDRIVIYFSKDNIKPELQDFLKNANSLYHITGDPDSSVKKIFDILLTDESVFTNQEFGLYIKDMINLILAHLKYSLKEDSPAYAIPNETVTKILNYIDENITDPLNADLIAAEFFVSKSWLSHNFKKYLNTSLKKYINQKKLLYIERLVIAGIPIVKAAESCSYTNYTTFFRQYKQYTNKKPRETKQSLKS